jgi:hypothetical protein
LINIFKSDRVGAIGKIVIKVANWIIATVYYTTFKSSHGFFFDYLYAKDKNIESLLEKFSLTFLEKKPYYWVALLFMDFITTNNNEIKE